MMCPKFRPLLPCRSPCLLTSYSVLRTRSRVGFLARRAALNVAHEYDVLSIGQENAAACLPRFLGQFPNIGKVAPPPGAVTS
jgi:hypothetical protein